VSTSEGDATSRLENALADVFAGGAGASEPDDRTQAQRASSPATDDWNVDDPDDEPVGPVTLPEIVPATIDPPAEPTPSQAAEPTMPAAATPVPARPPATAWGDHMTNLPANAQGASLRAPGRRPRVRRVTRVLRHIDPWSTFKVALLFSVVAYLVSLTAGVLLWRVADSTGTLDNVERWFTQFGWETFEFKGGEIFHNAWIIGLFGAVALTGGLVLLATLFNLVSDIVGGVRLTVLEEEVVERTVSSTRRYVVRRAPGTDIGGSDDWDVDDDEPDAGPTARGDSPPSGPSATEPDDWSIDGDDDDSESHDAPPAS
jgi:hypothetical protein